MPVVVETPLPRFSMPRTSAVPGVPTPVATFCCVERRAVEAERRADTQGRGRAQRQAGRHERQDDVGVRSGVLLTRCAGGLVDDVAGEGNDRRRVEDLSDACRSGDRSAERQRVGLVVARVVPGTLDGRRPSGSTGRARGRALHKRRVERQLVPDGGLTASALAGAVADGSPITSVAPGVSVRLTPAPVAVAFAESVTVVELVTVLM